MVKQRKQVEDTVAAPEETALKTPKRASECRQYMRDRLTQAFPAIVEGFVKGAQAGSCAHVKLAAELLAEPEKKVGRTKGSAARLRDELTKSDAAWDGGKRPARFSR